MEINLRLSGLPQHSAKVPNRVCPRGVFGWLPDKAAWLDSELALTWDVHYDDGCISP